MKNIKIIRKFLIDKKTISVFKNYKINIYTFNKVRLYSLLVAIFSFFLTLLIAPWHYGGDQIPYQRVYDNLYGLSFIDGFNHYKGQIASVEFIHFSYIYIFSNLLINKVYAMAIANAILGFLTTAMAVRFFRINIYAIPFVISNYYLLSLFFTLERLKFAIIFILLVLFFKRNKIFLYLMAIMSHLSITILIFLVHVLSSNLVNLRLTSRLLIKSILGLIFFLIFCFILFNIFESQINQKIPAYLLVTNFQDMLASGFKTSIFMFISYYIVGKFSFKILIVYIPLISLSIIIEPARINFFAYIFLLYFSYLNFYKIKTKVIFYSVLIYYSATGFNYLYILHSNGG